MLTSELDYNLPKELIAENPPKERGTTRLLVVNRSKGTTEHKHYVDIVEYINPGDVVVLNNTKVIKARVYARVKRSGREVECLFLKDLGSNRWEALIGFARYVRSGDELMVGPSNDSKIKIISKIESDSAQGFIVEILHDDQAQFFNENGNVPLPAYIKRKATKDDEARYNTIFGHELGSVAAPTASLNLTEEMLAAIKLKGAKVAEVELKVGWGTFAPIRTETVEEFKIHTEEIELTPESAENINKAIENGCKVWAFGTTAARTLESCADGPRVKPYKGETNIFIYPGYRWKIVDRLVTNFHAPRTSLIALVSSLASHELIIKAYDEAVTQKYSFLSYGDSMLII